MELISKHKLSAFQAIVTEKWLKKIKETCVTTATLRSEIPLLKQANLKKGFA
jgi:hypothetical protein